MTKSVNYLRSICFNKIYIHIYLDGRTLTGDCWGDDGLLWLRNWLLPTDLGGPAGYPPTTGWLGIIITFSGPTVI